MERINHSTETERAVLVIVDVQNDFVDGSLAVPGGAEVIPPLNKAAEYVRRNGGDVVLTRDWHPKETPHFGPGAWPVHCVAKTGGAAFHRDLAVSPDDIIISKGMGETDGYSGFEGQTDDGQTLEQILSPRTSHERVVGLIGGLAIDYCVKSTVVDGATAFANDPRVRIFALIDASRAVNLKPTDEADALAEMEAAGAELTNTQTIINEIFGE